MPIQFHAGCGRARTALRAMSGCLFLCACGASEPPGDVNAPAEFSLREESASSSAADFTLIQDLDVDSRGFVYVAGGEHEVTVLDPTGRVVRTVGREGAGPGEFRGVWTLQVLPGDSLMVFDANLARLTVFRPHSGEVAYVTYLREQFPLFPYWARRAGKEGALLAAYRRVYGDDSGRDGRTAHVDVLRLLAPDGSLRTDSALLLREQQALDVNSSVVRGVFRNPFGRRSIFRVDGAGRIVSAWTDSLLFHVHSAEGRLLSTIVPGTAPAPRPVTASERDSVVALLSNGGPTEPVLRRALERLNHRTWPLLHDFILDDRNRIWYALWPSRDATGIEWTAVDERGRAREQLTLPTNARLWTVRGRRAYVSETDSLDVPRVVIYDLQPAPAGGAR
jgi:hypothetical protein